jgi:hypothetical protein
MYRRILAMTLAFFLVDIPLSAWPAGIPALGVVTQASAAHFNTARVSAGTTVYDGDRLSTESEGLLQFRGAGSLLYLPGRSGVTLHRLPNGTQAHLSTGGLIFSSARASAMEILANDAFIRPAADVPTVAQVTLIGPKELQITARRGAARWNSRIIPKLKTSQRARRIAFCWIRKKRLQAIRRMRIPRCPVASPKVSGF